MDPIISRHLSHGQDNIFYRRAQIILLEMKKIHFYPILKYRQIPYFKHMNAIFALTPAPSRVKEENMGHVDTSVPDLPL